MENNKLKFKDIFIYSVSKFHNVFDLFELKFYKFILYFLILNLLMMFPLSIAIINMEEVDYSRYGMDFAENIPDWLPSGLPANCEIINYELQCATDTVFEYDYINNGNNYHIYFNVSEYPTFTTPNTLVFRESTFELIFSNGTMMEFTYGGFEYLDFGDLHDMSQEEASDLLFDSIFLSIKPEIILPLMAYTIGILLLTNFLLIIALATLSMMFKFTQSDFIKYKDMIKLMIIASTFPSFVNLGLNSFGMSAFTSISYNYITPIIAFFIYSYNINRIRHEDE